MWLLGSVIRTIDYPELSLVPVSSDNRRSTLLTLVYTSVITRLTSNVIDKYNEIILAVKYVSDEAGYVRCTQNLRTNAPDIECY